MKAKNEAEEENKEVYIKIDQLDSVDLRKALLEIEASNVNMQIIAERLKEKSRNEIRERALAKRNMREVIEKINEMTEKLPKTKIAPSEIRRYSMEEEHKLPVERIPMAQKKENSFMRELEEIKRKIASL